MKIVYIVQGCQASGKSRGNFNFFKVRELSGNFANCQGNLEFLARLHEVHRTIAVTPVVHVPVPVRVTLALKVF